MLEKVLNFQKNIDISNRYIGRHWCTLPIYCIEKNIDVFSKWTPVEQISENFVDTFKVSTQNPPKTVLVLI